MNARIAFASAAVTSGCTGLARRSALLAVHTPASARQAFAVRAAGESAPARSAAGTAATAIRSSTTSSSSVSSAASSSQPSWRIKMLYDGDCPLCMREVEMLQRRDAGVGRIAFVDVAAPDYDPANNAGISFEAAMERIHAIEADGTVVVDVEVFRRLYEEVGLGWVYGFAKNPTALALANKVYAVWAEYRLPLTGRPDLAQVLAEKKTCRSAEGGSGSGASSA